MAVSRTEQLLETLEGAASEAHAAEALYALLQATRAVPITFAQRSRAESLLQGRLLPRGRLGPEHPLVKLLALRLSTHYLPGVSELPLSPSPRHFLASHAAAKPSPATAPPAVEGDKPAAAVTKQGPRGVSSSNGVVARSSNNGDNGALLSFLFQPLPRGTKALCIVTRSSTRLKPAVYRLYVEALVVGTSGGSGNGGGEDLRQSLRAAGLDPRWVVGGGSTSASLSPREEAVADAGGEKLDGGRCCLLEARRLTAAPLPVAKAVQVAVYACASSAPAGATEVQPTKGQGGRARSSSNSSSAAERTEEVGRLQSPAPGVLTATATAAAAAAAAASSPVGSRLCVQVCERKRLLSLSVALPVAAGRGNLTAALSAAAAEGMEVPVAHLQALCGGNSANGSSAVFGARSRPPRWSALDKLYTLDFENGARRVREPSRKNVSLLPADAAQLAHNPADHHHHRGGRGFARGGGGAGAVAQGAAAMAAAATEGWGRESKQPRPVLQLGKIGEHTFSLDFRAPFSPFQALAVAVAAFEA